MREKIKERQNSLQLCFVLVEYSGSMLRNCRKRFLLPQSSQLVPRRYKTTSKRWKHCWVPCCSYELVLETYPFEEKWVIFFDSVHWNFCSFIFNYQNKKIYVVNYNWAKNIFYVFIPITEMFVQLTNMKTLKRSLSLTMLIWSFGTYTHWTKW